MSTPGQFRPGPPPGIRPGPQSGFRPGPPPPRPAAAAPSSAPLDDEEAPSHPAVDAAVTAVTNAAGLSPADQIAQYEAAYETLRETLATIDQA